MSPSVRLLARHASRHHGLFRSADAERFGFAPHHLRHLVERGWCERLAAGIYRVSGAPATPQQRLLAEVLRHPSGAVAGFRAAGSEWNLLGLRRARPEVIVPHGQNRHRGGALVHATSFLPPQHTTVRDAIPLTTPARTLFDLAGVLPAGQVERIVDDALQRRLVPLERLRSVFFGLARRGRPGTATMRTILEERGDGFVAPASELERVARVVIREAALPMPQFEVQLGDDDWIGRVDCLWADARLVLELDGRRFHGGASAREADRERENRLVAAGWRVLRLTWHDLVDRPAWCAHLIRSALAGASG